MRIKIMKKFFNRWKTNFLQEMKSSGGEGIKKGSEDDYQELTMKFMMVIYVKCFT